MVRRSIVALPLLRQLVSLAQDLGTEVIRVDGCDIARELARVARERRVTLIVIGQPARSRWHELAFGLVVNRLLREQVGASVYLVPPKAPRVTHAATGPEPGDP
jgi:two-component system, OmpR family, sensor histidine kinase KdpD